jgi:hypothetical protein
MSTALMIWMLILAMVYTFFAAKVSDDAAFSRHLWVMSHLCLIIALLIHIADKLD